MTSDCSGNLPASPTVLVFLPGLRQYRDEPPGESCEELIKGLSEAIARREGTSARVQRERPDGCPDGWRARIAIEGPRKVAVDIVEFDYRVVWGRMWARRLLVERLATVVPTAVRFTAHMLRLTLGRSTHQRGAVRQRTSRAVAEARRGLVDFGAVFLIYGLLPLGAAALWIASIVAESMSEGSDTFRAAAVVATLALPVAFYVARDSAWWIANDLTIAYLYTTRDYCRDEVAIHFNQTLSSVIANTTVQPQVVVVGFSFGAVVAMISAGSLGHSLAARADTLFCVGAPIPFLDIIGRGDNIEQFGASLLKRHDARNTWFNIYCKAGPGCIADRFSGPLAGSDSAIVLDVASGSRTLLSYREAHNNYWADLSVTLTLLADACLPFPRDRAI